MASREAARSENRLLDVRERIERLELEADGAGGEVHSSGLQHASAKRGGSHREHHPPGRPQDFERHPADGVRAWEPGSRAPSVRESQARETPRKPSRQTTSDRVPRAPSTITPASVPAAADSSRLCSTSPSCCAFSRVAGLPVLCARRASVSLPSRARDVRGRRDQPFGQIEQAAKRASIKRGQRASEPAIRTKPVSVFNGTVSAITGSCGLSLPSSATATSTSKRCRQHRGGQLDGSRKISPARGLNQGSGAGRLRKRMPPAAPRESCAPSKPAESGRAPR